MINYFAPRIFQQIGLTSQASDLFATGFVGLTKMFMTLPSLALVDRAGRRPLMLFGTTLMCISFFYIGFYQQFGHTSLSNDHSNDHANVISTWGYIAIACVYVFMTGYSLSWGVMHYVIPAEVYPQDIRAKAETVSAFVDGGFQLVSIKLSPVLLTLQGGGAYFISGGLLLFFLIWIFICIPETKGISLEDMEHVFKTWKHWQPVQIPAKTETPSSSVVIKSSLDTKMLNATLEQGPSTAGSETTLSH